VAVGGGGKARAIGRLLGLVEQGLEDGAARLAGIPRALVRACNWRYGDLGALMAWYSKATSVVKADIHNTFTENGKRKHNFQKIFTSRKYFINVLFNRIFKTLTMIPEQLYTIFTITVALRPLQMHGLVGSS